MLGERIADVALAFTIAATPGAGHLPTTSSPDNSHTIVLAENPSIQSPKTIEDLAQQPVVLVRSLEDEMNKIDLYAMCASGNRTADETRIREFLINEWPIMEGRSSAAGYDQLGPVWVMITVGDSDSMQEIADLMGENYIWLPNIYATIGGVNSETGSYIVGGGTFVESIDNLEKSAEEMMDNMQIIYQLEDKVYCEPQKPTEHTPLPEITLTRP